jgi:succinate dehydrogenase/fumarate reductase flavoprotein subunit
MARDMAMASRAMDRAMDRASGAASRAMDMARDMARARNMASNNTDKNLLKKLINFNLFASASLYAKETNMNIDLSKQDIQNIVDEPLSYFKDDNLSSKQIEELEEVFEKSPIIEILKKRLESKEYQEFNKIDEDKALESLHQDIKALL